MHFNEDIFYWLAATRIPGVGPITFRRLLDQFGDITALFSASVQHLQAAGLSSQQIKAVKEPATIAIERDINWSKKSNCSLITWLDAAYPTLLHEISDPPLVLFVQGDYQALLQPQIAIVGSRNPTPTGREMAEQFAYYLAKAGFIVTSGLALGVDAASHRGALTAGRTIAVMGTGLDRLYPHANRVLARDIVQNGALVSEFSPDTPPVAKNFPRRNRIISGLSLGVLVIEAALKSGSLITARFANEQGREVFAIPGSIHNPLARGCHALIRQGAKLVETADDIIEELGSLQQTLLPKPPVAPVYEGEPLAPTEQALLTHIAHETTSLETIIVRSGLTASEVSSMLLSLELQSYVLLVPGGYVRSSLSLSI